MKRKLTTNANPIKPSTMKASFMGRLERDF